MNYLIINNKLLSKRLNCLFYMTARMNKYILVTWPDSQKLMEQEWFQDCILLNDNDSLESFGSSAYLVPEDKYEELYPTNKGDISDENIK